MQAKELLLVGRVARAHGLKGECKVIPECDDPMRLLNLDLVWVGSTPAAAVGTAVDTARLQRTKRGVVALVRLGGAQTSEEASQFWSDERLRPNAGCAAARAGENSFCMTWLA